MLCGLERVIEQSSVPLQVCPAGWKPGESTMKPDPKGKLDYFAAI